MDFEALNARFSGVCKVVAGKGGLPFVRISNNAASAEICLLGAHITSYIPKGYDDVMWMSDCSEFQEGKAIRGGIPLCWPWFGKNTQYDDAPSHGIARISMWQLDDAFASSPSSTTVCLSLSSAGNYVKFFPYAFRLELKVTISDKMTVALKTINLDKQTFSISQALHSYFKVGNIDDVSIDGFDGLPMVSKVGEGGNFVRKGIIAIDREVDEVYQQANGDASIADASLKRRIVISKKGSASSVVWNPWIDKSKRMADFPDDGYKTMVCVETANAMDDSRTIPAGGEHEITAIISAESI